ncbi:MAG: hypothetical protein Q9169_004329 [Polycauliona sp. 2 TL-2023]
MTDKAMSDAPDSEDQAKIDHFRAMPPKRRDKIQLDGATHDAVGRLGDAITNLRTTAHKTRRSRMTYVEEGNLNTIVGSTENITVAVYHAASDSVESMPKAPEEWIDLKNDDFKFVWENFEALKQAMPNWKTTSDDELETLKEELSSVWKIAATFDATELIAYGLRGA